MDSNYLDFEQPIAQLLAKIEELRNVSSDSINISEEIRRLESKSRELTASIFKNLSDWQISQLARHPQRPFSLDYIHGIFTDFDELHGDRAFADDKAIVGGTAYLNEQPVMVIGQQKGRTTKERLMRNFGSPHPEGYRKAKRLMELAERFNMPIITFVDTPGAFCGIEAEERGQSEAIAKNLEVMSQLSVPVIVVVIGEGCSGGALGIGVGDRVLMLQYSYYATISPEGCASILFKDARRAPDAAQIMGITADRLLEQKLIDEIVQEPLGGAHRNYDLMMRTLKSHLLLSLHNLLEKNSRELVRERNEKLANIGFYG